MARSSIGTLVAVAVASCLFAGAAGAQTTGDDPFIGIWRINLERSTYSPGPPPPPDFYHLRQFAALEDGWNQFVLTSVSPEGAPTFQVSTFKVDGQQYPVYNAATVSRYVTTGQRTNLTRSYRRIDSRTVEFTSYTDGVAGLPTVRQVSADGRTYTDTTRGTNAQGVAIHNVVVWDRVR